jgi:hypothetical protein
VFVNQYDFWRLFLLVLLQIVDNKFIHMCEESTSWLGCFDIAAIVEMLSEVAHGMPGVMLGYCLLMFSSSLRVL